MEKAAHGDMTLFYPSIPQYPEVAPKYQTKVFEQFRKHYELIDELVMKFHGGKLYKETLLVNGAILKSLNIYRGGVWSLGQRNPHVFFDCLRSQCETLALLRYCIEKPDYVTAATLGEHKHPEEKMRLVNILTMVDRLDKKHEGIRHDYDDLCEFTHPNPDSLYANILPLKEEEGVLTVEISTKSTRITSEDADKYLLMLTTWTDWIFDELVSLTRAFTH